MNNELIAVLDYLENERGIDRDTLMSLVEESLVTAARKVVGSFSDLNVTIDRKTGDIQAWAKLKVVEEVEDRELEISLDDATARNPDAQIGEEIDWEVTPENFGRIAAQATRQAIQHRLRKAEKDRICEDFEESLDQLISGVVTRVERGDIYVDFRRAEGVLRHGERIPGEDYRPGDHISTLLVDINSTRPGPSLIVSRNRPLFVQRLFEREVTEIGEDLVTIHSVAREAGYRTKIAVSSSDRQIDPVGACVGLRGNRVKTVVRELGGEKVDIIEWSENISSFVGNALQPAKLDHVDVDEPSKTVHVSVAEDQLSLAIGKRGQNARLAAKLTGWKIDINRQQKEPEVNDFQLKIDQAIQALAKIPGIDNETAKKLVQNGFLSLEGVLAADINDLCDIEGIDEERAQEIVSAARSQMGL